MKSISQIIRHFVKNVAGLDSKATLLALAVIKNMKNMKRLLNQKKKDKWLVFQHVKHSIH